MGYAMIQELNYSYSEASRDLLDRIRTFRRNLHLIRGIEYTYGQSQKVAILETLAINEIQHRSARTGADISRLSDIGYNATRKHLREFVKMGICEQWRCGPLNYRLREDYLRGFK